MPDPKIIFLDVDGVLVHNKTVANGRDQERLWRFYAQLDEACVKRLVHILKHTDARIVVSSTWRMLDHAMAALGKALRQHGAPHRRSTIIGRTGNARTRLKEMQAWLAEHPEIEHYIAIDDEFFATFPSVHVNHGFQNGGLQDEHVDQAVALLAD